MIKVLLTGATGFVGSHIVRELLNRNDCIVVATSANAEKAADMPWFDKVNYIPFKLEQFDNNIDYCAFFGKPDVMIHAAWEGLPNYKSLFHFETNLPRHYVFLKNCISNGLANVTVIGTCLEYGMKEGKLTEEMPTEPGNPYALAKDTLRKFLEEYKKHKSFNLKWVRLFYLYGEGQNSASLLPQLHAAVEKKQEGFNMSGGQQVRDYLDIATAADYITKVAMQNKITGLINCSSNNPVTLQKFVEDYITKYNINIALNLGYYPYTDYEPMFFWGDNAKLIKVLNNE